MGVLIDGVWQTAPRKASATNGRFVRAETQFRNWITATGEPGPSGDGGFAAEPGRYHLYVSLACPWAHRTLIVRKLKELEDIVSLAVVNWRMGEHGWTFEPEEGVVPDPVLGARHLHQIYAAARSDYTGRVSVPVLWDKKSATIVSNESSEIIRMFNKAFDEWARADLDFYPVELRGAIDEINTDVYTNVNNGVYRSGFATTQDAYEEAVTAVFDALDRLEERLGKERYLTGGRVTEADWRLFTTLVRFDPVYHGHFKCNRQRLIDYPNLWNYLLDLYQVPGVAATVDMFHIKHHYYGSHESINPSRIVPAGPVVDYDAPHDRDRFQAAA